MNFLEMAAVPINLTVRGKTYKQSILSYLDHAEAGRQLVAERRSAKDTLKELYQIVKDDEGRSVLLRDAYRDTRKPDEVDISDILRWYATPRGMVWRQWKALQEHHASEFPTIESVDKLLVEWQTEREEMAERADPEVLLEQVGGLLAAWVDNDAVGDVEALKEVIGEMLDAWIVKAQEVAGEKNNEPGGEVLSGMPAGNS